MRGMHISNPVFVFSHVSRCTGFSPGDATHLGSDDHRGVIYFRVKYRDVSGGQTEFTPLYPVLSLLSYMCKAPLVKPSTDVVNSLDRQRNALDGFLKVCIGLECNNDLLLETLTW